MPAALVAAHRVSLNSPHVLRDFWGLESDVKSLKRWSLRHREYAHERQHGGDLQ
jgi:hypothetical protein